MKNLDQLIAQYIGEGKQVIGADRLEADLASRKIKAELFFYFGSTPYEKFFNYLIKHGNYLHGTTADIPANEKIKPGINGKLSAAINGGVAIMYSLFSNKPSPYGVKGINRKWEPMPFSRMISLELGFDMDKQDYSGIDFEDKIKEFSAQTTHESGRIYLFEQHPFAEKRSRAEMRSDVPVAWILGFETKYEWFKGKVYGAIYDFDTEKRQAKMLISKNGVKLV